MANLTKLLQDEIRRLARKEIRAQNTSVRQAADTHRREIAAIKKTVQDLQKQFAAFRSEDGKRLALAKISDDDLEGVRFSPRSVRAHRKRLKLSAEEYSKLVGVSMQTIYHWEQRKSRPRRSQMAALVAVRAMGRREALKRLQAIKAAGTDPSAPQRSS